MTGFADIKISDAFSHGVEAVFSKPFNRKGLLQFIQKLIMPEASSYMPRAERFHVNLAAEMVTDQGKVEGTVENISQTGMYIVLKKAVSYVGVTLAFKVSLSGRETIAGKGTVKWARGFGCGVQFIEFSNNAQGPFFEFLNKIKTNS